MTRVRLPGSLRGRLFLATTLTVLVAVGITLALGAALTRREVERTALGDLAHQADLLAGRERAALLPLAHLDSLRPFLRKQGEQVATPRLDAPSPYLPDDARLALRSGTAARGTVHIRGRSYDFAAEPVGNRAFELLRPTRLATSGWRRLLGALLIAAFAGVTLAAATSFGFARIIARPVRRVADAARRLGRTQKAERLPLEGARELAALAASFNELSDQLERAREAERSFLLSVSHELKTPLTAIRAWSEALEEQAVSPQQAAKTVASEALRLERLVGDLLDLARMNKSEFSVQRTEVEFAGVLAHVARRYEHHARGFDVELQVAAEPGARALGDADRILQIVSNLVENALRLTPPGGAVRVSATGTAIAVADSGPGLAPEDLERAFERFYLYSRYGRERRVGTGLGLAIVDELVRKMGGTVTVRSDPGDGTVFTLRLPVSHAETLRSPRGDDGIETPTALGARQRSS